ncbi:reverse transcriptase domain-containing protein, partial [Klebsiella pneumoniae]|uniref:reverse transcriptase domain-containing protein n=1 Tax=Klebsiella pneumoniae TaxID=573 RepID=UPI003A804645
MDLPPGHPEEGTGRICRLRKAIYGLKQSPRAWYSKLSNALEKGNFVKCASDHSLFIRRSGKVTTIVLIYVDDIIVTGNVTEEIIKTKNYLMNTFGIKDLGKLRYFLGIEIARSSKGINLSQRKYAMDILKDAKMTDCKPIDTPIDPYSKLGLCHDEPNTDKRRFQQLVGNLIYLSATRPDISYAVNIVSRFMQNPKTSHMNDVIRVLRNIKGTLGQGLWF